MDEISSKEGEGKGFVSGEGMGMRMGIGDWLV